MSPFDQFYLVLYLHYRYHRLSCPTVQAEHWVRLYGAAGPSLEARFLFECSAMTLSATQTAIMEY